MPPASNEATSLTGTLEIARRDLLDLGLRNTLLNYRPLRSKGIEVIDEKPIEVFQLLVKEEMDLSPKLRQTVKSQNTGNGNFDSWEFQDERLRAR